MKKFFLVIFLITIIQNNSYSQEGWFVQYGSPTSDFTRVFMIDSLNGWALDSDSVFNTTNGGFNWVYNNIGYSSYEDVYFININTGWIITSLSIINTTNTGQNWVSQFYGATQYRVYFVDANTGFTISGMPLCRYTTNSGNNWITFSIGIGTTAFLSIDFVNHDTGWIGGANGVLFKTTNCGINWVQKNTGADTRFYGLSFVSVDTGWAGGFNNFGDSKILFTSTGGESWLVKYTDPINQGVENIFFTAAKKGWAMGFPGKIIFTTDAGITWQLQNSNAGNIHLFSGCFINSSTGWIVGEVGGANGKILKTTTGGIVPVENNSGKIPKDFKLFQNYPNPFNISTIIEYDLPYNCYVNMTIFNVLGDEVKTLINQSQQKGKHRIIWDADNYSSGLYFYQLRADRFSETKKMILIK